MGSNVKRGGVMGGRAASLLPNDNRLLVTVLVVTNHLLLMNCVYVGGEWCGDL